MVFGAIADVHGSFDAMNRAMARHPEVPFWLCVGDLASPTGRYVAPVAPLYWIKGNNEDFDRIAGWIVGRDRLPHLHYIPNGTAIEVGPLRVAALGGTFAPTWYRAKPGDLPHSPKDDKRKHFVEAEVDLCRRLTGIDVLLTHEAPRPFMMEGPKRGDRPRKRWDAGKHAVNEVLAEVQPRLHLCGHHHRFVEATREGVLSICMDRMSRGYMLFESETMAYEKIDW